MKCQTFIGKDHEEEVLIFAYERNELVLEIEKLVSSVNTSIVGKDEDTIIKINPLEVTCFMSYGNKVFACIGNKKYQVNLKLYQLEEKLEDVFIKINQSCIANIKRIKSFSVSLGGSLQVNFDNGLTDYISRRELKNVKTRIGI